MKNKVIPVTGRIQHCLNIWLIDDCDVVKLTSRQRFTPQEDSWYSFLTQAESIPGP
jgi:hypothetical protein